MASFPVADPYDVVTGAHAQPAPVSQPAAPQASPQHFVDPYDAVTGHTAAPQHHDAFVPNGPAAPTMDHPQAQQPMLNADLPKPFVPQKLDRHPVLSSIKNPDGTIMQGSYESISALQRVYNELHPTGVDLTGTGNRSKASQQHLYDTMPKGMAALPGHSNHEGNSMAYDLSGMKPGDLEKAAPILEKYGFARPMNDPSKFPYEPWHFTWQPGAPYGHERIWADNDPKMLAAVERTKPKLASTAAVIQAGLEGHGFAPDDQAIMQRQQLQENGAQNPKAASPVDYDGTSAYGLFQMKMSTAAPYLLKLGIAPKDFLNSAQAQTQVYSSYMEDHAKPGASWAPILAAYNAGDAGLKGIQASGSASLPVRQYVAHVLGIGDSPQALAQANDWIVHGGGPAVKPINRDADQSYFRQTMHAAAQKLIDYANGDSGLPGMVHTAMAAQRQADPSKDPEAVAGDFNDLKEIIKETLRAVAMGIPEMADHVTAWEANKLAQGLDPTNAKELSAHLQPMLSAGVPWGQIAHSLQPSNQWQRPLNDFVEKGWGAPTFLRYLGGLTPLRSAFGLPRTQLTARGIESTGEAFALELPKLLGIGVGIHAMAAGAAGKLGMSGVGMILDDAVARRFPGMLARYGGGWLTDLLTTTGAAATQMMTQAMGDAYAHGATTQEAAHEGLTAAVLGSYLGPAAHFGIPLAGKAFGSIANTALGAADSALGPTVRAGMGILKDATNPLTLQVRTGVDSLLKPIDAATGGKLSGLIESSRSFYNQMQTDFRDANVKAGMVQTFSAEAERWGQTAKQVNEFAAKAEQNIQTLQVGVQQAQGFKQKWAQNSSAQMTHPEFGATFDALKQVNDGLTSGNPGLAQAAKWQGVALDKELKKLPPDVVQAARDGVLVQAQVDRSANQLAQALQTTSPEDIAGLKSDAVVYQYTSDFNASQAATLQGKTWNVGLNSIVELMKNGQPPANAEIAQTVVTAFNDAINDRVATNKYMVSTFNPELLQLNSQTSRTLAQNASTAGSPISRMGSLINALEEQRQELLAGEPKKPPKPSGANLSTQGAKFQNKDWENKVTQYNADHAAWQQQVKDHGVQLGSLKEQQALSMRIAGEQQEMGKTGDIPGRILINHSDAIEDQVKDHLKNAGIQNGYEQLDRMYNAKHVSAKEAFQGLSRDTGAWKALQGPYKGVGAKKSLAISDLTQEARQNLSEAKSEGLKFAKVQVPLDWVDAPNTTAAKLQHLDNNAAAQPALNPQGIGYGEKVLKRPLMLGQPTADGKLSVLDGNARLQKATDAGRKEIQVYVREDHWNDFLKFKLGDTHDIISDARGDLPTLKVATIRQLANAFNNPGKYGQVLEQKFGPNWRDIDPNEMFKQNQVTGPNGVSTGSVINTDCLAQAKAQLASMSMDEYKQLVKNDFEDIRSAFYNTKQPSESRLAELKQVGADLGFPPMANWMNSTGASLRQALEAHALFKSTVAAWREWKRPGTLQEMMARTVNLFRGWADGHGMADGIANPVAGEVSKQLDLAIKNGAINVAKVDGKLPLEFRQEMTNAVESMTTDQTAMKEFLTKHPGMFNVLGAHFDVMRMMEQFEVTSPDLKTFFNPIAFFHKYPGRAELLQRNSGSTQSEIAMTRLITENLREIPTFKEGEALYQSAHAEVTGSNAKWDNIKNNTENAPPGDRFVPPTHEEKERRFWQMNMDDRRMVFPGKDDADINRLVYNLALKNPNDDPIEQIRGHVKNVLQADNVRTLLRNLTQAPIPGAGINALTDRPYSVVERFKSGPQQKQDQNGAMFDAVTREPIMHTLQPNIPSVPVGYLKPETAINGALTGREAMMPLTGSVMGFAPNSFVQFMGENVPASELYIHPDVARYFAKYFQSGDLDQSFLTKLNGLTRRLKLIAGSIPHLITTNAMHAASQGANSLTAIGQSLGRLARGQGNDVAATLRQQVPLLVSSPLGGLRADLGGQEIAQDLHIGLALHAAGARQDVWATAYGGEAANAGRLLDESGLAQAQAKGSLPFQMMDRMMRKQATTNSWNALRDGESMGLKVADMASVPFGVMQAQEHFMLMQPIKNAMKGAWLQEVQTNWNAWGEEMAHSYPPEAVWRLVQTEAADKVNRNSMTIASIKDPQGVRNAFYKGVLGQFNLVPGMLRSQVHTILAALPENLTDVVPSFAKAPLQGAVEKLPQGAQDVLNNINTFGGKGYGSSVTNEYSHLAEAPDVRLYNQNNMRNHMAMLVAGGFAGANMLNLLGSGHTVFKNDPNDPKALWKIKIGDKYYSSNVYGTLNTVMSGLGRPDALEALGHFAETHTQPLAAMAGNMAFSGNRDKGQDSHGNQMWNPYESLPGKAMDLASYALHQSVGGNAIFQDPRHYQSPMQRAAALAGFEGYPERNPSQVAQKLKVVNASMPHQLYDSVSKDLETFYHSDEPQWKKTEAMKRAETQAKKIGIPVYGEQQELNPGEDKGRYRADDRLWHHMLQTAQKHGATWEDPMAVAAARKQVPRGPARAQFDAARDQRVNK